MGKLCLDFWQDSQFGLVHLTGSDAINRLFARFVVTHFQHINLDSAKLDILKFEDKIAQILAMPQIRSARIKAIAVSTMQRSSALPDVPTLNESGLPGYNAASWYALLAPARTPKKILETLSREVVKIMRVPDVRERFANDGFEPAGYAPAESAKFLREELVKWAKVVKAADIKPE